MKATIKSLHPESPIGDLYPGEVLLSVESGDDFTLGLINKYDDGSVAFAPREGVFYEGELAAIVRLMQLTTSGKPGTLSIVNLDTDNKGE